MPSKKTWIWIIVTCLALCVVALLAVAAFGVYFVASHISTKKTTSIEASRLFDEAKGKFKDQKPLYELDQRERPRLVRQLSMMPTAAARPEYLIVMAWDPDDQRVVEVTLPFWLLRMGRRKIKIDSGSAFDLERLDLDVKELERVGSILLFDYLSTSGERVLVWTR